MGTNKHISVEKKKQVIHLYYNRQQKQPEIALDLQICLSAVKKILARYRADNKGNHAQPTLRVLGRPRILEAADVDFIISLLERTPDIYLREIQTELWEICGVEALLLTIWRAIRQRRYTRKRVSRVAAQRNEDTRANYQIYMTTTYRADQLVFVDEAACNHNTMKRAWAWAPIGEDARRHDVYIRGIKYSVLPALSSPKVSEAG